MTAVAASNRRTLDDEFVELAQQLPGFGGLFYDTTEVTPGTPRVLNVYLTDRTRAAAAQVAISAFLERQGRGGEPVRLNLIQGRYDFSQLASWYQQITSSITVPGITLMDVDDMRNLVVIGVANSAAEQQVRAEIKRLDVPMEAILVERVSPVVMDVTVRERVRPVPGGVQVMNSLGGICTLGVNLQRRDYGVLDGRRYFVTNSHCTGPRAAFGVVTGVEFGQPDLNNLIGTEVLDPPLFTNAQVSSCPPNRACRYSDAALIEYTNSSVSWDFAKVAQVYWPSLTLSSTRTRLSGQRDVFVGDLLQKIGRTTGLSGGRVDRGCARVPQFERAPDGRIVDTGRTMLCQVMSSSIIHVAEPGC